MATLSQLNSRETEQWLRRFSSAAGKFGIRREDYQALCLAEHQMQRWYERECNGEIERDEPTDRWPLGRPSRWVETDRERWCAGYVRDTEAALMRNVRSLLAPYRPVILHHWQTDPRGCALYIYRSEDVPPPMLISESYSTHAHACYF